MTDDTAVMDRIRRDAAVTEARLTRALPHPPEAVWSMLTDSAALAQWLAEGRIDLRPGGRVHIDFGDSGVVIDSTVLDLAPPHRLAYSWSNGDQPARPLHWSLEASAGGTLLALTVTLPAGEDLAKACAGFAAHLEMLAAALESVPARFPFSLYLEKRKEYQALLDA